MAKSQKVWSKFTSPRKPDLKLRITDMPVEKVDEVLDMIMDNFVPEESTFKAAGVSQSEEAKSEYRYVMKEALTTGLFHTMICSVDNGSDEIGQVIGSSLVALNKREDPKFTLEPKTPEFWKVINHFKDISTQYNAMEIHNLDSYYAGRGATVHKDYRGLGIAQEFLKARRLLCKEEGVPMTGAWMTSIGTQKAAERDGWETVLEINNHDYASKHELKFEPDTPNSKYMIGRAFQ